MQMPLSISFHNLDHSPAVEARIRTLAIKLERYCDQITHCRVAVEQTHQHHQHGNLYRVRIDLGVPDQPLVASHGPGDDHAHVDVYVAIRDAFDAMERQLSDYRARRYDGARRETGPELDGMTGH